MIVEFKEKYDKMVGQLTEINQMKSRGLDVSIVKASFQRLCDKVDKAWLALTQKERNGFETTNTA